MNDASYSRIVYSPDVKVYILPGVGDGNPIDISNDIIEGSVTRITEGVSTASFLVQSRKLQDNATTLLGAKIRPMDRIVVYLKKVTPILVFSGYLDVVPIFQAVPEPFVIEASCTLKRLEFTYWDPQLPHVYEILAKFGFIPGANGEQGLNFFTAYDTKATGDGPKLATGPINDTGFGAMLYFLLHNVGGWTDKSIWIDPLPVEWMQRAYYLFQVSNDWNERYNTVQSFLKSFLTSGGTSGDGDEDGGSATINNESTIKAAIANHIKKNSMGSQKMTADDFITPGKKYNVDPRFLAALALSETHYGTNPGRTGVGAITVNNCYGYGYDGKNYDSFSSFTECVEKVAKVLGTKQYDYYLGDNPNQTLVGMLVYWNKSSDNSRRMITKAWKQMETVNDKVNLNKPYSATGQGIATSLTNEGTSTRETVNGAPSDRGPDAQLSVYIEAGHSGSGDTRQPGYQGQGGTPGELTVNINMVNKIKDIYNALPDADKDKLNISFVTNTSRPKGVLCDVYLSIHHDPEYAETSAKIGWPTQYSFRGDTEDNRTIDPGVGKSGPNRYSGTYGGGPGFKMPESGEGGRNDIRNDLGLIKNSTRLVQAIQKNVKTNGGIALEGISMTGDLKDNRPTNYYGFYYSLSAACALIELPSMVAVPGVLKLKYDIDKVAKAIIGALKDYLFYKTSPKLGQAQVKAGTNADSTDFSSGDNSDAAKLIQICNKAAQVNKKSGYTKMVYETPGTRDKKLSVCIEKGLPMDCSGFIDCGLLEIGKPVVGDTSSFWKTSELIAIDDDVDGKKTKYEPGMFFIKGKDKGSGPAGHMVMVTSMNGDCVHCTDLKEDSTPTTGPQFGKVDLYINSDKYDLCKHPSIGSTKNPGSGDSDSNSNDGSAVDPFIIAKSTAFNIAFNFPGSMLDSVLLTGERALENDVKLLDTIQEVCKASQRTFSSLPNGDFIAWYPDYFNLAGKNAWLKISPTEIKSCTISLNDNNLVTHLYILGNPFGYGVEAGSVLQTEWYEKLMGSGVVTIERPWVLDSFLRPFEEADPQDSSNQVNNQNKISGKTKYRPRPVLETQSGGRLAFLERYGARPYFDKIPTIRHPILEFFYAYHTFIQKWAEQYISRAEFTFMPEIFPGMILDFDMRNGNEPSDNNNTNLTSVTFYVKDVTHNFSYENGFSTTATLMAPGTTDKSNAWAMVLVKPPNDQSLDYKKKKTIITTPRKPRTVVRTQRNNPGGSTSPVPPRTQNSLEFPSIDQTDGGNN